MEDCLPTPDKEETLNIQVYLVQPSYLELKVSART
jgi:hypothetical protein